MDLQALTRIKNWVFDLDDTLYPSSAELYAQMCNRIKRFIMDLLNVDEEKAWDIQKNYYVKYGATVRGLVLEHKIKPETFNEYVHQLDLSPLKKDEELNKRLSSLHVKKFIFTNGAKSHAERVTQKLGIAHEFEGIFSISDADFIPKPSKEAYLKMLDTFQIEPNESVMLDDNQRNLKTAHEIGMKTVWINANFHDNVYNTLSDTPDFCDFQTPKLATFLKNINVA